MYPLSALPAPMSVDFRVCAHGSKINIIEKFRTATYTWTDSPVHMIERLLLSVSGTAYQKTQALVPPEDLDDEASDPETFDDDFFQLARLTEEQDKAEQLNALADQVADRIQQKLEFQFCHLQSYQHPIHL